MDVHLTSEQEARLAELAAREGCAPDRLAAQAIARYLDEEVRFAEAVRLGIKAAESGDFVVADQAWARIERILTS
jgi:predicted transcriptional regulator